MYDLEILAMNNNMLSYVLRLVLEPEIPLTDLDKLESYFNLFIKGFHIGEQTEKKHNHYYIESFTSIETIRKFIQRIIPIKGNRSYSLKHCEWRNLTQMQYPILNNPTEDTVIFYNVDKELEQQVRDHKALYNSMQNTIEAYVKARCKDKWEIESVSRLVCEFYKVTGKLFRSGFIQSIIDTLLCKHNEAYYEAYITNQITKARQVDSGYANPAIGYSLKHPRFELQNDFYKAFE